MGKTKEEKREYHKAYHKMWYEKNREKRRAELHAYNKKKQTELRGILQEAKAVPCTDCGIQYPYYVMQFDHIADDKSGAVAHMIKYSEKRLKEEIAKCEVVCANCHCERTHQRRVLNALIA